MIRKDCAHCIDLGEYGALCDHPCRLVGGEPVEISGCPPNCNTYEERMSSYEMRERIHNLEDELREKSGWLDSYARQFVPLKVENIKLNDENTKLRELVKDMWQTISRDDRCGWDMGTNCCASDECTVSCRYWYRMKELGIEVE